MTTLWKRINRIMRHCWIDESDLHRLISPVMLDRLQQQINTSERQHTGEIRICVEASLPLYSLWRGDPMAQTVRARAVALFSEMAVWDTANNNGVLIYVLQAERAIEIIADRGINAHVPLGHWQTLVTQMGEAFQKGLFEEGLTQGVNGVTDTLTTYFPTGDLKNNPNELPDRPVLR